MLWPPPLFSGRPVFKTSTFSSVCHFVVVVCFVSGAEKSYDLTTQCPSIFKAGQEVDVMCTIHSDTLFTSCNGNNPSLVQFTLLLNGNQFPMCLPEGPPYTPPECPPPADECNCQCKSVSGNELTYSLKFRPTESHDGAKIWCTVDCLGGNPSIGPGCNVSVGKWTLLHIFQTASFLAAPNQIWSESYRYEEAWNQLPQTVRHTPLSSSTHSNPPPQKSFLDFYGSCNLRFFLSLFFAFFLSC